MTGSDIQDLLRERFVYFVFLCLLFSGFLIVNVNRWSPREVEALTIKNNFDVSVKTVSSFTSKIIEENEVIPYETEYVMDDSKDKCSEDLEIEKGKNGTLTKMIEITYYQGEEFDKRQIDKKIISPISRKMAKGTKTVYKNLVTANGEISYSCKLGVFRASAYDSNCKGCSETTATGLKAGFGVVAVDPKVIPLGTKLYITGYGSAVAGDTGGAIKGETIDLGFDKIDKSWGTRNVEVYHL
mgnify:CR=1 FL=1